MERRDVSPSVYETHLMCAGCQRWVGRERACQAPGDVGQGRGYCPGCLRYVEVLIALLGRCAGRTDGEALCLAVREIHDLHAHHGRAWPLSGPFTLSE